jgi:hypothetical protein
VSGHDPHSLIDALGCVAVRVEGQTGIHCSMISRGEIDMGPSCDACQRLQVPQVPQADVSAGSYDKRVMHRDSHDAEGVLKLLAEVDIGI